MKFSCSPRNKANMRCCRNITRCQLKPTHVQRCAGKCANCVGKMENTALAPSYAAVCQKGFHRGVANVAHRNKSRSSSLILAKDRLKHPFEISSAAFVHAASNARTITALRSLGVLENDMEHHAQILLALFISSALCLAAWIWARRRLTRLSGERPRH